ncbi:MAG: hypothetical protein SOT71_13805 [Romboutsia timonensis]|uniref:hypothetical protein n=1 Tax=Romboutsia timonensis TaxID=1776391 RepID=UPI002A74E94D|nr:hypothetical protein [Romboutsia timonensis]MDY2883720.1 hypothetical protein [Romboutsia timonensis]
MLHKDIKEGMIIEFKRKCDDFTMIGEVGFTAQDDHGNLINFIQADVCTEDGVGSYFSLYVYEEDIEYMHEVDK